jgi:hypothetical protein
VQPHPVKAKQHERVFTDYFVESYIGSLDPESGLFRVAQADVAKNAVAVAFSMQDLVSAD